MIPRRNPRRPFSVSSQGLKRITLGDISAYDGATLDAEAGGHAEVKPLRLKGDPSGYVLAAAYAERGGLDAHAKQALAAAALIAAPSTAVIAVVLGECAEDLAPFGADLVLTLATPGWNPERDLAALCEVVARYSPAHIFLPDAATGAGDLARRLAAALQLSVAAPVAGLSNSEAFAVWRGGGQAARRPLPRLIVLADGAVEPELPFVGKGEHQDLTPPVVGDAYQDLGLIDVPAAQVALEEADFILSAGNGVDDVPTFLAVAEALGAAVGASRVAVDDGKFARSQQIGATGKTVSASAYLAVGISGAVQHLQGIKACRHVIAINRDAAAPMIKRANLSLIGDAQEILTALLRKTNAAPPAKDTAP